MDQQQNSNEAVLDTLRNTVAVQDEVIQTQRRQINQLRGLLYEGAIALHDAIYMPDEPPVPDTKLAMGHTTVVQRCEVLGKMYHEVVWHGKRAEGINAQTKVAKPLEDGKRAIERLTTNDHTSIKVD